MLSKPTLLLLLSPKKISQYSQSTQLFATLGWQSPTHPKPEPLQSLHVTQLPSFHLHRGANMRSHVSRASRVQVGHREGQRSRTQPQVYTGTTPSRGDPQDHLFFPVIPTLSTARYFCLPQPQLLHRDVECASSAPSGCKLKLMGQNSTAVCNASARGLKS